MGYTHYYKVSPKFNVIAFAKVATDFKKMIEPLRHLGVILADGLGENYPTITPTEIRFNGWKNCGHKNNELGIAWPSENSNTFANKIAQQMHEITSSAWFAAATLESRRCHGDCSHETFLLEQKLSHIPEWKQADLKAGRKIFEFTKTAYKPYDLAVNVCLIIAKEHLGKAIIVQSDGASEDWMEAMQLCQQFLGYGADYTLDEDEN